MVWRVEICNKPGIRDSFGEGIKKDIADLGFKNVNPALEGKPSPSGQRLGKGWVKKVKTAQVYLLDGEIDKSAAEKIARELLADKITQNYSLNEPVFGSKEKKFHAIEIAHNPGVMDPVEESALKGVGDLGIKGVDKIRTAAKFLIEGNLDESQIKTISEKLLYNKVIQHVVTSQIASSAGTQTRPPRNDGGGQAFAASRNDDANADEGREGYKFNLIHVDILDADDKDLMKISKDGQLFLNVEEMKAIKGYFSKLGRNPTDCELESLAQTWSEHCKHKTLRGLIEYKSEIRNPKSETNPKSQIPNPKIQTTLINNLLKETVMKVTKELKKPWCVSVFKDNSGIIRFNEDYDICFKVETHNHPSALEPYGGAGTGIGGVIRDILGSGLGAKPVINTDIFCFGPPDYPYERLPKGALHPKRVMKGVVSGVRDYGNRMGIPTSNGAVLFDERYIGNPLVFCGNVGLIPKDKAAKKVDGGEFIVLVGGKTGRDGIHGATFSSAKLTAESEEASGSAVQIGNPITEKKITDVLIQARDEGLYKHIDDCGAGGLSGAVGEMGEETGAEVYLDRVPLKYENLSYTEVWISEAQERMVLAVEPSKLDRLLEIFSSENVEATIIGKFTDDKKLHLTYNNEVVADLDMDFLHHGLPKLKRKAVWKKCDFKEPGFEEPKNLGMPLKKILSCWNVASKEWIIRQYDHEVQGGSVLKPLQGVENDGPGDASVTKPLLDSKKGIIISNGINPRYGLIDPYHMAASAIDEALRQVISVGGNLNRLAILDNFCWGNTDKPDRLGGLVRAAFACYDIAKAYGVPFISGKDSLNNEYAAGGKTISIPPTLLISAMGIMPDVSKVISMDFKKKESLIYVVGLTKDELGGSHYYHINGHVGKNVPQVDAEEGRKLMSRLSRAIREGLVLACHDCSEGGIGVSVSEMAFSGELGAEVNLKNVPQIGDLNRNDKILFSESNTRFIAEVPKKNKDSFEKALAGIPFGLIGKVTASKNLRVFGIDGNKVLDEDIGSLKRAWQKPFKSY